MSADNRGGGVTYRERKKKGRTETRAFFLALLFFLLARDRWGYLQGRKRKDGDWLSFWLCFFLLLLTRDGWW